MLIWFIKLTNILLKMNNRCIHCFYTQIINKRQNSKYVSICKLTKEHKKIHKLLYDVKQINNICIIIYRTN